MLLTGKRIPLGSETFSGLGEAARYDEHARLFMGPIYRDFARQFRRLEQAGGRILDVGCGSALLSIELAGIPGNQYSIVALDVSTEMLDLARRNLGRAGLEGKIELRQGSAATMPLADASFDYVVSNASLHSWSQPLSVFGEIERVLKPGGVCLIRDNLRLPYFLFPAIEIASRWKRMSSEQRRLWWRAVRASYTPAEVKRMLKHAHWEGARVVVNERFLDLTVRSTKRR